MSLVKSQDPYYDRYYSIYNELNQDHNFYSYFNGTKILSKKGVKYEARIDVGKNKTKYQTYTCIKAPSEDAPWVESYNEVDRKNLPCRNIEVIDINDAINSTYRTGSNRYFIYLAKGDSFKSATAQITDFIKANVFPKGTPLGDYTAKNVIKMEINDIDITGNIYDLLYIEPVRGNVK